MSEFWNDRLILKVIAGSHKTKLPDTPSYQLINKWLINTHLKSLYWDV